jgi:hypothetical protein
VGQIEIPDRLTKTDVDKESRKKRSRREEGKEWKERVRLCTRCCCCSDDEIYFIYLSGSTKSLFVLLAVLSARQLEN